MQQHETVIESKFQLDDLKKRPLECLSLLDFQIVSLPAAY